ncbi:uncharacterized protein LOC116610316 isoform X2 [Nematostella vectensis]|uniref:uncharacterized protein LOC116610316 isoform X2 n=1 Tax=Nematostella vectensis TaxID=45351 RepID=UPI002076D593|nr:uncharacterized protein LOC116610316 isoform X2 [Nematostella vectensis]XP_048587647.1 uncharacterized protein LOC116610316 isoform X2 [Nematostella vectensis]XP_048587648.1 uncharacterized protein LOC116610316 isoform X2 [Nematostella vectensis]XP_048587649.1 uncharacterized protein LOC116610316 isoform X2 [Nematostella vectensis]XP_048587650.1 uncharacterized protein LOC116610316 isoform X2 [Nematostella vectensis]
MASASGDMASASGDMASASGDMASASGDMASASGDMASPSGDMASPSGDMASASGAGEAIFQVISMNAGQKIKIKGGSQQRREYVRGVIDEKKTDLVFLQEFPSPAKFREEIPPTGYQILSGVQNNYNYTTILYKNELEVKEYNNYDNKSFAGRLYVGRCKKDGSLDLLVASYHGANTEKGLNDKKEENLCKLLTLLDGVSFNEGCPVLVGGDFNLNV